MASYAFPRFSHMVVFSMATAVLLVLTVPSSSGSAQQEQQSQQQSQSQQSTPAQPPGAQTNPQPGPAEPKKRKIWTNDDVVSLRTPADNYLAQKEQQEAAAAQTAEKAAADAKLAKGSNTSIKLPSTIEETQKLIKAKEAQIDDEQSALERLIRELPDTPEDQKPAMQKEIDRVAADVPKVRNDLKSLQSHLEKLTKAQLNDAATSPPTPPSL